MRNLIIKIAQRWPGHQGTNYDTTSIEDLLLLIEDAVEADRMTIEQLQSRGIDTERALRDAVALSAGTEWDE